MKLQYPLLITLFFSMGQGKKHYTQTSVDTIRYNLAKYHDTDIKRRWAFKCLEYLTAHGYIRRHKRHENDSLGHVSQKPSLIIFTLKGMAWLAKMGIQGAREIYRSMIQYLNKGHNRWPSKHDFDDGSYLPDKPHDREAIKSLLVGIGTSI